MIPLGILAAATPRSGGGGDDPYWGYVVSLLNFPGADGSTDIVDEAGKTWVAYGDAQIDTSLGYNTCQFDGAGDYIETPHNADFVFGAGDFTVEGVARLNSVSGQQILWEKRGTGFSTGDIVVMVNGGQFNVFCYEVSPFGDIVLLSGAIVTAGTSFHWAWTREGTKMALWFNGVEITNATTSASLASASTPVLIGKDNVSGGRFWLNGRVLASRVTKGVCRYTGTFTPPAAPFPVG